MPHLGGAGQGAGRGNGPQTGIVCQNLFKCQERMQLAFEGARNGKGYKSFCQSLVKRCLGSLRERGSLGNTHMFRQTLIQEYVTLQYKLK